MLAALHAVQIQTALQDIFAIQTHAAANYRNKMNVLLASLNLRFVATAELRQDTARATACGGRMAHATVKANVPQGQPNQMDATMVAIKYAAKAVITAPARTRKNALQDSTIQFHADFAGIKQERVNPMELGVLLVHAQIQVYAVQEQQVHRDVL